MRMLSLTLLGCQGRLAWWGEVFFDCFTSHTVVRTTTFYRRVRRCMIKCCVFPSGDCIRWSDGQAVGCDIWGTPWQLQGAPVQPQVCCIHTAGERYISNQFNITLLSQRGSARYIVDILPEYRDTACSIECMVFQTVHVYSHATNICYLISCRHHHWPASQLSYWKQSSS